MSQNSDIGLPRWMIMTLLTGTLFSVGLSVAIVVLLFANANKPKTEAHFFEARNPQTVVPLTVQAGGKIQVTATKCNLTTGTLVTKNESKFIREKPFAKTVEIPINPQTNGEANFPPGCVAKTFEHDLSKYPEVGVGVWHLEGKNTTTYGGQTEVTPWYSQSFEVVP